MKRLILLSVVLSAAGLPLTAAAFDYGSAPQRMLAVEAGAPSLPGDRGGNDSFADPTSPRAQSSSDDTVVPAAVRTAKSNSPHPDTARRNVAPNTTSPGSGAGSPQRAAQSALSWQSLLPGSIQ